MKVVSFGGHEINDGVNYKTSLTAPGQTPAETEPQLVGRTGAPAVIGGVVVPPRFLVLRTTLVAQYSELTRRELQQQWYAWCITDSKQSLIVADDDGQNQRYVEAMPFSIIHEDDGDGLIILTTMVVDGDVMWRAVTATVYSWNITASGETLAVVNGSPAVNEDAYPTITATPREYATGINPHRRFMAVGWRSPQPWTNYSTDIANDGLDTRIASTHFASAAGNDIRVYVDAVEVDYWLDGPNTATTKVFVNLNWQAGLVSTLANSLGTGAVTTLTVDGDIGSWPESGLLLVDGEVFVYSGKTNATKTFTGVTRGGRGTGVASHSAGAAVVWVQHEIWVEYGDGAKPAKTVNNDYRPMFNLATSTNGVWDYDDFAEVATSGFFTGEKVTRGGTWRRGDSLAGGAYGGNQFTNVWPAGGAYGEMGLYDAVGVTTKTALGIMWFLANPCGISAVNFQNGEFWHGRTDWFKAYVESNASGTGSNTTRYTVPAGTNGVWNSWSQNVTGLPAGTQYVFLALRGYGSSSYAMRVECSDVTVTLDGNYTPVVAIGAEENTYRLRPTLVNQTTGESLAIDAALDVDEGIEIDVANHQVTLLSEGTDAYNAVETVEGVRRWMLRLQAGENTLRYDEAGVVEVDVEIEFRRRYRA